jgi:hypothetical protein
MLEIGCRAGPRAARGGVRSADGRSASDGPYRRRHRHQQAGRRGVDFVADERNEPRYKRQMRRAEKISEGPIGVGTQYRAEVVSAGRPVPMIIEFTGYDRPRRLASSTRMSSMQIQYTLAFEPVPEGTRMRWSGDVEPGGILKLMSPWSVGWAGDRSGGYGPA